MFASPYRQGPSVEGFLITRWLRALRLALVTTTVLASAGCANVDNLYAPNSIFGIDQDIADMHQHYGTALAIKDYYAAGVESEQGRNEFIAGRLSLYNLEYLQFVSKFMLTKAQEESIFDLTATGLGLATTIAGAAQTKAILGAVTTALTGTRSSFDKNFFNEQTASALITQMNAQRKAALVPLLKGMKASIADYPLSSAIVDLDDYQSAGTIQGALEGVQTDASAKDAQAQTQIDLYRTTKFSPDTATERIMSWLYPGVKSYDHDTGLPRDASGAPVQVDSAHRTLLTQFLTSQKLDGIELAAFLDNANLAAVRADAVSSLKIP